jgi:hypothetical protein
MMPEESRSFIEGECLRVARLQAGCQHLKAVAIARMQPSNDNPNWEVLAFNPELPTTARAGAIQAIEEMRGQYRLAPHVAASNGGRVRGHRKSEG